MRHTQPQEERGGGATYPTNASRARYACDGGESIDLRFFIQESRAVLVREEKRMELQQQRTGSGFLYSNGPTSIRGKSNDLRRTGSTGPTSIAARYALSAKSQTPWRSFVPFQTTKDEEKRL